MGSVLDSKKFMNALVWFGVGCVDREHKMGERMTAFRSFRGSQSAANRMTLVRRWAVLEEVDVNSQPMNCEWEPIDPIEAGISLDAPTTFAPVGSSHIPAFDSATRPPLMNSAQVTEIRYRPVAIASGASPIRTLGRPELGLARGKV